MAFEWIVRVASGPRDPNRPGRQWPTVARTLLFRAAVIGISAAFLWVIVGSVMYPSWWYEMLWRGEILDPLFISNGCTYLLDNELWLAIAIPILAVISVFITSRVWPRVSRLLDRHGGFMISICAIGLLLDAGVLYHTQRAQYQAFMSLRDSLLEFIDRTAASPENPLSRYNIELPVSFQYLESDQITAIYSQTEALLAEREHTISSQDKIDTSAGLGHAPLELKADASTQVTKTQSFKSIELSPERKCLEVMKALLRRDPPAYYSTASASALSLVITEQSKAMAALLRHELKMRRSWFTIRMPPVTKERLSELQNEIQKLSSILRNGENLDPSVEAELKTLSGLIIVGGVFRKTPLANQTANFGEQFATGTRPVWFRFNLRDKAALDLIHDGAKLRVLGNVIRPWDGGRYLELYPIAIF